MLTLILKKKKGVFGCLLSHIKLLTTFINSSLDYIIVSEDNIQIVQDDIHEILKDIIANVSFSIIFLCCLEKPPDTKLNRKLNSKYSLYDMDHHIDKDNVPHCDWYGQGARLYIISRGGASELLSSYYKKEFKFAIDWEMIYDITNPLIIYPSLCSYNNKNSSINKRGGH